MSENSASYRLTDFVAAMSISGVAWSDRFEISISTPKCLQGTDYDKTRLAALYADHVDFPPLILNNKRLQIYGASEPRPQSLDYGGEGGLAISFLLDKDMDLKSMYDYWLQSIVDVDNALVAYQSEYISSIQIKQLDKNNNVTYLCQIDDAYPYFTQPVSMDNSAGSSVSKLLVGFTYRKWKNMGLPDFGADANQTVRNSQVQVTTMAGNSGTSPDDKLSNPI